ncbi:DNA polymerase III subunit delta [Cycloclasticus sp. 46_120_T64]|nr:DNA polymerase III subunit delta [Cycloclasticus sp. 46_120_T64]
MQLELKQLTAAVDKQLAPVYFVSGDEPLQQGEAVDYIRKKARAAGFLNREVFHVEGRFDWNQLIAACFSQSLFAERNLIELNLPTAKPGRDGSKVIEKVLAELSTDNLLIIIAGKLDKASKNTKWFKSIDQHGVVLQVWPLQGQKLYQWLQQRLQTKGLSSDQQGIKILADSVEGNLLAAAQEIEKLHALHGAVRLSADDILSAVADNARYDVFTLADSLLAGDLVRTVHVLRSLQGEKLATPVILWALLRELRVLVSLSFERQTSGRSDATFKKHRVWESKKAIYKKALSRGSLLQWQGLIQACAQAERVSKGVGKGDEWLLIEQICLAFCEPKRIEQYRLVAR